MTPSFTEGGAIPAEFTCEGKNFGDGISPEVHWTDGPTGTMSYAVAFKDMTIINSANPTNGYHWLMWNIPESINMVPKTSPPKLSPCNGRRNAKKAP